MLEDLFRAYYAADPQTVEVFCRKHGVDYMLVEARDFTPGFLTRSKLFVPWYEAVNLPSELRSFFGEVGPHWRVKVRAGGGGHPSDHPFFAPFDELIAQTAGHGDFILLRDHFPAVRITEGVKLLDMRAFSRPQERRRGAGPARGLR
jgi:hypothetical protein